MANINSLREELSNQLRQDIIMENERFIHLSPVHESEYEKELDKHQEDSSNS